MSDELLDARGVKIEPGDAVIYGYGVGRSVAMAEGEAEEECSPVSPCTECWHSGRYDQNG